MSLNRHPTRLVLALIAVALAMGAIDLLSQAPRYFSFTFFEWRRVDRVFHMGRESNLPAWYSTILLFVAGLLLGVIAAAKRRLADRFRWHWLALAAIFIYLSADEASMLHEEIGALLSTHFPNRILQFGGWIGFAVVGMTAFGVVFFPFWLKLERRTRWLFALSAAVFLGGAMGVESLSVAYETGRTPDYRWAMLTALEEIMEISGIAVFIGALLNYLKATYPVVELEFGAGYPQGRPVNSRSPASLRHQQNLRDIAQQ